MAGAGPLHFKIEAPNCPNKVCWQMGRMFSASEEDEDFRPPTEAIELQTKMDSKAPERIYPELAWNPLPLMSRRLVEALQDSGVDNLQVYETKLANPQGRTPANHYLAVNIVGLVAAADMANSETNPAVTAKKISMDFHSLAVDPAKTRDALMFRLAENVSAVLVHERVKNAVTASGVTTLTWFEPEEWAG
jgi:hypothetical protein